MIGQEISHYRILERLGGGGMGEVFKAEDLRLGRPVALKFLPPELGEDPVAKERFVQEARAASALDHPNICTLYDIGESDDGQMYLAMAFYEGETLKKRLAGGPLAVDEALEIAEQVAEGLAKAHGEGITHRDVKPANLMITRDGVVKIVDFGLAKLAGDPGLTRTGTSVGTPAYMSPEQARSGDVNHRTDLWSLGVVLYEMLAGRRPFRGSSEGEILHAILYEDPEPLSSVRAGVPPGVERLVHVLLVRDPARRLSTSREALRRIRVARAEAAGLSEDPTESRPAMREARSDRAPRTWVRRAFVAGAVAGLGLAVALVTIYLRAGRWRSAALPVRPLTSFVGTEWTGSWSPDGSQIALVHTDQGSADVSVMSLGGGERRLVAGGPDDELTPRWSPDGSKIAFLSDRGRGLEVFWVPPTGGSERRVASTGLPFLEWWNGIYALGSMPWSPDGRHLVFSRRQPTGGVALWRLDVTTGEARQLTDPPRDTADLHGAWSPDGRWIAFSRYGSEDIGLWRLPSDGGDPVAVAVDGHSNRGPSWTPDGRRLIFFSARSGAWNLWECSGRGDELRQLTSGPGPDYLPVVSSSGQVLFTRWGHQTDLYWLDLAQPDEEHRRLTFNTRENFAPRVAADGDRIAYHSDRSGNYEIWLLDRRTGEERSLTDHPAEDIMPDWSPSGDQVVFLSDRAGAFHLWAVEADGSGARRLSDHPVPLTGEYADVVTFGGPRWSPDGDAIGFLAPGKSGWTLWLLDLGGGKARASPLENVLRFDWYLDSRRVVYIKALEEGRRVGLFAADLASGEEVQLLDARSAELDVSPDGSGVAYVESASHFGMNLYLLTLEPPTASGLPRPVGKPEPLTDGGGVWHVHGGGWTPDGQALVYTRDLDHGDLYVLGPEPE